MRKLLLFLLFIINFSVLPLANAKDQVIIDRITDKEAEQLDIHIPDDVPPGFHTITIEVYDEKGTVSKKNIAFCKDEIGDVHWDNNCPNLKIDKPGDSNSPLVPKHGALANYNPISDKKATKGIQIAAFAILSALTVTKRDDGRREREDDNEQESLQGVSSGSLDILKNEPGRGDLSRIWVNPLTERSDALFVRVATFLNGRSALLTRTALDGSTIRAIFGGWSTFLPIIGAFIGIAAIVNSRFESLPPVWWIVSAVMAIALFDAMAGFIAGSIFFLGALFSGNITGRPEFLSGVGVLVLFFAPALLAISFRSFRRLVRNNDDLWERITDYLLSALLTYWVITKMVAALRGLAHLDLPITDYGTELGILSAALLLIRMALEDVAIEHFPMRLRSLHIEIASPTHRQQIQSLVFKILSFFIMAAPFVGSLTNLLLGTLIFAIPLITSLKIEDRLPKRKMYLPTGVFKTVVMVFVMAFLSRWIEGLFRDTATFLKWNFVVMALPGFLLHYLDAISDSPDPIWRTTRNGRLTYRLGGVVIFSLMVPVVMGVDIASWLVH